MLWDGGGATVVGVSASQEPPTQQEDTIGTPASGVIAGYVGVWPPDPEQAVLQILTKKHYIIRTSDMYTHCSKHGVLYLDHFSVRTKAFL